MPRNLFAGLILLALALEPAVWVSGVEAQARGGDSSATQDEQLTTFAKAYAAIALARGHVQAELAEPKNKKDEVQKALQEKLRRQVQQILQAQNITDEQYRRMTYQISTDDGRRKNFEEILARLTVKKGEP